MLTNYIPMCAPNAAYITPTSLNIPVSPEQSELGYTEIIETIPDIRDSVEVELFAKSSNDLIHQFIIKLPHNLYWIAYLKYWCDWSQTKIAEKLGVTNSSISHSLKKIKKLGETQLSMLN